MSYFGTYNGNYFGIYFGTVFSDTEGGGGYAIDYRWFKKDKKQIDETIDAISEIIKEFSERPNNEILEKAAYQEIKILEAKHNFIAPVFQEIVPQDRAYITYEQTQKILHRLTQEYIRHKLLSDEDEVIAAFYTN